MKIKGTCLRCGRELLADQVIDGHGHCPWCGRAFNADYTVMLSKALDRAQAAGSALEEALEQIGSIELALSIDDESVLGAVRAALTTARRHSARI